MKIILITNQYTDDDEGHQEVTTYLFAVRPGSTWQNAERLRLVPAKDSETLQDFLREVVIDTLWFDVPADVCEAEELRLLGMLQKDAISTVAELLEECEELLAKEEGGDYSNWTTMYGDWSVFIYELPDA